ncbi:PREDICTED: uncharacterized protein LOC108556811 [Nicrophorus vespilloides]|uniref:Uncharacterized protein LOC108556811 n=1 Tax=Nicrophorus vespilloides TaxID=110193 RepID=A0ABM1M1X1_NICVS|nr:PREDICTED: uncharacterized protein LOC108556811 [Nicrophorus vespilloides]
MSGVLLESRPFRPFKSSEEYLYAMREDLAEWLDMLYPHLRICTENFMDKLETGVALCEHANAVKVQAASYVQKKQARKQQLMMMSRSVTGSLAQAQNLVEITDVKYFSQPKPGSFFARDNLSNFIRWCRESLQIIECLLFESDDLIMRKNEKHVILCLLEVARRGAKFGMLAPMLVQMERQIDREIAADQRRNDSIHADVNGVPGLRMEQNGDDEEDDETDSEMEDEQPVMVYGPLPQIVTNDLKSLDEMVRDLVEKCTCPTQFPMIRVSEGKYRIGDTKVLIFVRILRNHVMVRVGGGWDTLSHYLDKHDPCRCRAQHRTTQGARLISKTGASDLQGAQVYYDRSAGNQNGGSPNHSNGFSKSSLGPPMNAINRSRSRSPSRMSNDRRSVSPFLQRKSLVPPANRSRSPTPNYVSTHTTKLSTSSSSPKKTQSSNYSHQSLPYIPSTTQTIPKTTSRNSPNHHHVTHIQIPADGNSKYGANTTMKAEASLQVSGDSNTDHSDNASEVSDEGYRSLGVVVNGGDKKNRNSLYSQNSAEDVEEAERQLSNDFKDECVADRKTLYVPSEGGLRLGSVDRELRRPEGERRSQQSAGRRRNSMDSGRASPMVRTPSNLERPSAAAAAGSRRNSAERKLPISPKRGGATARFGGGGSNSSNTWNGRQRAQRPSLNVDTFTNGGPFSRNSPTRSSVSSSSSSSTVHYDHNGRRLSHSAATSPTKSSSCLKEELIREVSKAHDNKDVVIAVTKLLKMYGSMNSLNQSKHLQEDVFKKRKDSKPENFVSRIPAPVLNRM